jgi:hypothetical protein
MTHSFHTKLKKVDGKMVFPDVLTEEKYKLFMKKVGEGEEVKIEVHEVGAEKTLPQLRMIYGILRNVSKGTGEDFSAVKKRYKEKVGMVINYKVGTEVRELVLSFADLELDDAVYVCNQFQIISDQELRMVA